MGQQGREVSAWRKIVWGTTHLVLVAGLTLLCSCGGGSSPQAPSPTPPPQPTADFSLTILTPSVSAQQNGIAQMQAVQATGSNGFSGSINLAVSGIPDGVTMAWVGPASVAAGSGLSRFQFMASTSAAPGNNTVTVTGTSGSLSHSVTFTLQVTQVAPFALQVVPGSLTMGPDSAQRVQVSLTANPGHRHNR